MSQIFHFEGGYKRFLLHFNDELSTSIFYKVRGDSKSLTTAHSECQADPKTFIEDEILQKIKQGENVEEAKAHVVCVITKLELLSGDGKVNKAKVKAELADYFSDEAKLDEVVEKCAVEKDNPEDTALALDNCFRDAVGGSSHAHHHHD